MNSDSTFKEALHTAIKNNGATPETAKTVVKTHYNGLSDGQVDACARHAIELHEKEGANWDEGKFGAPAQKTA